MGTCTGRANTTGSYNTFIGTSAGRSNTSGSNNTFMGCSAGCAVVSGSNNLIIGTISGTSDLSNTVILAAGTCERLKVDDTGLVINGTLTGFVTETGTQTLTNKTFSGAILNDGYTEEVFAVTGTTPALSPSNGSIQTWTLSGNSTPTAGTWAAGQSITLMIDDGSAYSITWTSLAVTWVGGTAPTLATTGYNVIQLWKVGTTIYGVKVGEVA